MTTDYTFNLTIDQVDHIVITELQQSLDFNLVPNTDEGGEYIEPDFTLITALTQTLAYYMSFSEYAVFYNKLKTNIYHGELPYKNLLVEALYKWE